MVQASPADVAQRRGLTVVVTREREDAQTWLRSLSEGHWQVLNVPLLALEDLPAERIHVHLDDWCQAQALMFVSARAAKVLGRADLGLGAALQRVWSKVPAQGPRVWAPGPGTAQALRAQGVPQHLIDTPAADAAQFDSVHLWQAVAGQVSAGAKVILVRGEGAEQSGAGRDALRQLIQAAGGTVQEAVVYRRGLPQWSETEQLNWHRALQDPRCVWLVSSSLALRQGRALAGPEAWPVHARVLVTHPRMAATARELGCTDVTQCRPTMASVSAALDALSP